MPMVAYITISSLTASCTTMFLRHSSTLLTLTSVLPLPLRNGVLGQFHWKLGSIREIPCLSSSLTPLRMSTLSDGLRAHQHLRYTLSGSSVRTNVLLYADDTCQIADGLASCRYKYLLSQVEQWLQWTGMAAKVAKCCSLGNVSAFLDYILQPIVVTFPTYMRFITMSCYFHIVIPNCP